MNFLTNENVLSGKDLLEKTTDIKRFEYPPLDSGLKKQTSIAKDNISYLKIK